MAVEIPKKVVGGRAVSVDRLNRGTPHLLVVFKPLAAKIFDRDWLETERGRGPGFELSVHLRGKLPGCVAVGSDARSESFAVLKVTEIPDTPTEIAIHLADAERLGLGHGSLREPSRHKVPQKLPQTG